MRNTGAHLPVFAQKKSVFARYRNAGTAIKPTGTAWAVFTAPRAPQLKKKCRPQAPVNCAIEKIQIAQYAPVLSKHLRSRRHWRGPCGAGAQRRPLGASALKCVCVGPLCGLLDAYCTSGNAPPARCRFAQLKKGQFRKPGQRRALGLACFCGGGIPGMLVPLQCHSLLF